MNQSELNGKKALQVSDRYGDEGCTAIAHGKHMVQLSYAERMEYTRMDLLKRNRTRLTKAVDTSAWCSAAVDVAGLRGQIAEGIRHDFGKDGERILYSTEFITARVFDKKDQLCFEVVADFSDEKTAGDVESYCRIGLNFAKAETSRELARESELACFSGPIQKAFDNVEIKRNGKTLTITGEVPFDDIINVCRDLKTLYKAAQSYRSMY